MPRKPDPDPGKPCEFGPPGRNHRASFNVFAGFEARKSCGQHLQEAVLWAIGMSGAPASVYDLKART
jgi:hypothetical protein